MPAEPKKTPKQKVKVPAKPVGEPKAQQTATQGEFLNPQATQMHLSGEQLPLKHTVLLWWSLTWRHLLLMALVVTPVGLLIMALLSQLGHILGADMSTLAENNLAALFSFILGEYLIFLCTWVVWFWLLKKGNFNHFVLGLKTPKTAKGPLDATLPLAWGWYWRLFLVREGMQAILTATIAQFLAVEFSVPFLTSLGDMERYIDLLMQGAMLGYTRGPAIVFMALLGVFLVANIASQLALLGWFVAKRTFRTFQLNVEAK